MSNNLEAMPIEDLRELLQASRRTLTSLVDILPLRCASNEDCIRPSSTIPPPPPRSNRRDCYVSKIQSIAVGSSLAQNAMLCPASRSAKVNFARMAARSSAIFLVACRKSGSRVPAAR